MSLTSGCCTNGAPAEGPVPNTMLTTPSGMPASLSTSQSIQAVIDVISDGLQTHVLPANHQVHCEPHNSDNATTRQWWQQWHTSNSRCNLPCQQIQWQVPRRDQTSNTDRLADGVVDCIVTDLRRYLLAMQDMTCKESKVVHCSWYINLLTQKLANEMTTWLMMTTMVVWMMIMDSNAIHELQMPRSCPDHATRPMQTARSWTREYQRLYSTSDFVQWP
jgi:hypothetical protein